MNKDTPLSQNDNNTISKISSAAGIVTGITGGIITAGVINIAILSLGTPILGPEVTVLINLTGGLYASYKSIKASINISDNYITPVVKNILQSSVNYFVNSKSMQQDIQLPMNIPNENKQLPAIKEPDHLPMVKEGSAISKKEKVAKSVSKTKNKKKSSKTTDLKKPKIESKKNSDSKKEQETHTRG